MADKDPADEGAPGLSKSLSRVLKIGKKRETPPPSSPVSGSPDRAASGSMDKAKSPRRGILTKKNSTASGLEGAASGSAPKQGGKGIEAIQKLVSKNKRRFVDKEHGFNLDLSYIGQRVIAMGFPSEGKEAAYRNPMSEVFRFLETFHKGHYKVYNLCSERAYDPAEFHNNVARYPFDDHNAPPLKLIYECCKDIDAWMKDHPSNIACIHCKAGKGRTGVIIASWLQYNNEWPDADKALAFYAAARTHNQKGVTIPSQIRYVRYFGQALRRKGGFNEPPPPKTILLKELVLRDFVSPGELKFVVQAHGISPEPATLRTWKDTGVPLTASAATSRKDSQDLSFPLHPPLPLFGDIFVSVTGKPVVFHFWLSTAMMEGTSLVLQKSELDKANKDKKKVFPPTFNVTLVYAEEVNTGASALGQPRIGKENLRRTNEIRFPSLMML